MRRLFKSLALLAIVLAFTGCGVKVKYSFSGASISDDVKTLSVLSFQNRASLVQPGLSQTLTDALLDMCKAQTNLSIVASGGDVSFEGDITDYKTQPMTVSGNEQAAMNRF
ncbi:MAG TPA: LPS assembly lipoprotein LptE, partial [Bacteroidales bacterium]|nr:LPS assembly lipoprotein LptE [Bacteroidales bacterium]